MADLPLNDGGKFFSSQSRASVRKASNSLSIFSAADIVSSFPLPLLMIQQSQNAFGDDVALDFVRTAIDRLRLAGEPVARVVDLVARVGIAFPAQSLRAHHLDQKFGAILIHPHLRVLHDRGDGARPL